MTPLEKAEKAVRDTIDSGGGCNLAHFEQFSAEQMEQRCGFREEGWWHVDGVLKPEQIARAVLQAIREPSKGMLDSGMGAAEDALDSDYDSDADGNRYPYTTLRSDAPSKVWAAMIDKALSE